MIVRSLLILLIISNVTAVINETQQPSLVTVNIGYLPSWAELPSFILNKLLLNFDKNETDKEFDLEQLIPENLMKSAGAHKTDSIQELTCASKTYMGHRITGAFKYAVEEINSNKTYHNMNFKWDIRNGCSDELISTFHAMELWKRPESVQLLIGPEEQCSTVARVAAAQGIPIISYKCQDPDVSDKREFPTFARTIPAPKTIVDILFATLAEFDWHQFTVLWSGHVPGTDFSAHGPQRDVTARAILQSINEELERLNGDHVNPTEANSASERSQRDTEPTNATDEHENQANHVRFNMRNSTMITMNNMIETLESVRTNSKIFVLVCNPVFTQRILMYMGEMGYLDDGEYMFIALDPHYDYDQSNPYSLMNSDAFLGPLLLNKHTPDVMFSGDTPTSSLYWTNDGKRILKYAESLLMIVPSPIDTQNNTKFNEFVAKSAWLNGQHPRPFDLRGNVPWEYNGTNVENHERAELNVYNDNGYSAKNQITRVACYLYDAVMLYAKALNTTRAEFEYKQKNDKMKREFWPAVHGNAIANNMRDTTIDSMLGFQVRINSDGDAVGNFTVLSMQPVKKSDADSKDRGDRYFPHTMAMLPVAYNTYRPSTPQTVKLDKARDDELHKLHKEAQQAKQDSRTNFAQRRRSKRAAMFWDDAAGVKTQMLQFIPGRKILFPNGAAPRDEPECGFSNEYCIEEPSQFGTFPRIVTGFCIIVVIAGLLFFLDRQKKHEREIEKIWRIEVSEIDSKNAMGNSMETLIPDQFAENEFSDKFAPSTPHSDSRRDSQCALLAHADLEYRRAIESAQKQSVPSATFTLHAAIEMPEDPPTVVSEKTKKISIKSFNNPSMTLCNGGEMIPLESSRKMSKYAELSGRRTWHNSKVHIRTYHYTSGKGLITKDLKKEMRIMKGLMHQNINNFCGIVLQQEHISIVRAFCEKSSLYDVLLDGDKKIDDIFISGFVCEIITGLRYLHNNLPGKVHGNLKSTNCLLTTRWTLQVADYGLSELRYSRQYDSDLERDYSRLWSAPEVSVAFCANCKLQVIRHNDDNGKPPLTPASDVYSFGIILHEIFVRNGPYSVCDEHHDDQHEYVHGVIDKVKHGYNTFRPCTEMVGQTKIVEVMRGCWAELPGDRLTLQNIKIMLRPLFTITASKSAVDKMLEKMEVYQNNLEELVDERTTELITEKTRIENLMQRMLPKSVSAQLLAGCEVKPETYSSVTIYFSDIVGFTSLSAESTPMEVVTMLNDLYTLFDRIIAKYNVYKVETIGDAYMVVSGLPERSDDHAGQIGLMALHLLSAVKNFKIPHRNEQLRLRIGVHTGSCVTGVVGEAMPRYCLFGDTVNTASRMESTGEPLKIHCSQDTHAALTMQASKYHFEDRGKIEIKGKGLMNTYWLTSCDQPFAVIDGIPLNEDAMFPVAGRDNAHCLFGASSAPIRQNRGRGSTSSLIKMDPNTILRPQNGRMLSSRMWPRKNSIGESPIRLGMPIGSSDASHVRSRTQELPQINEACASTNNNMTTALQWQESQPRLISRRRTSAVRPDSIRFKRESPVERLRKRSVSLPDNSSLMNGELHQHQLHDDRPHTTTLRPCVCSSEQPSRESLISSLLSRISLKNRSRQSLAHTKMCNGNVQTEEQERKRSRSAGDAMKRELNSLAVCATQSDLDSCSNSTMNLSNGIVNGSYNGDQIRTIESTSSSNSLLPSTVVENNNVSHKVRQFRRKRKHASVPNAENIRQVMKNGGHDSRHRTMEVASGLLKHGNGEIRYNHSDFVTNCFVNDE